MNIHPVSYIIITIVSIGSLAFSCNEPMDEEQSVYSSYDYLQLLPVVKDSNQNTLSSTIDIDNAIESLTAIQKSGKNKPILYQTFPNIFHPECNGELLTYNISKDEFKDALKMVVDSSFDHYVNSDKDSLIEIITKPLEKYHIVTCLYQTDKDIHNKPPKKGVWIFPNLFGVNDLIINWETHHNFKAGNNT